jgi:hypothetical protein
MQMKKLIQILAVVLLLPVASRAQLTDGATAPDFTFTDIKGVSHNLYSYLNQGKYVAIDVSATWCGPCWSYHSSHTMEKLYNQLDEPGEKTWKVLFIEGDETTDAADLEGTGANTLGNWKTGVSYPIIDPSAGNDLNNFLNNYDLKGFPMLMLILPNKKAYFEALFSTSFPSVNKWIQVASDKGGYIPTGIDNIEDSNPVTIFPNPAKGMTTLYFNLNSTANVNLQVADMAGRTIDSKVFSNLPAGDQSLKYDVQNLQSGIYFFTIAAANNRSITKKVIVQ